MVGAVERPLVAAGKIKQRAGLVGDVLERDPCPGHRVDRLGIKEDRVDMRFLLGAAVKIERPHDDGLVAKRPIEKRAQPRVRRQF